MIWTPESIRKTRRERGWTQKEAARRAGMGRRTYIEWEKGRAPLDQDVLNRLFPLPIVTPRQDVLDRIDQARGPLLKNASRRELLGEVARRSEVASELLLGSKPPVTTGKIQINLMTGVTTEVSGTEMS